ncbi:PAS domain-containing protein, partial [candidate division KSB1 bacterium]|nr:PAS domain-containing protein [candidate division KSB1 bacterium]
MKNKPVLHKPTIEQGQSGYDLQRENDQMKSILAGLAEGVIVADVTGRFIFFNRAARDILGIGSRDINLSEWTKTYGCFHLDRRTPYPAEKLPLARALDGETVHDEPIFIRNRLRPEGIIIQASGSPIRDEENRISGGTVVFRDITATIVAEAQRQQTESRLTALFRGFPNPTVIWQKKADDFILIDSNDAAVEFTQGRIKNLLGSSAKTVYAGNKVIQSDFDRCFREKTTLKREMPYRLLSSDEEKILSVSYIYAPPDLILVHLDDLTEQRRNEREIRRLSSAVEQTADSVVITDRAGIIDYVNPAFESTTGYSREEAIGQTLRILKSGKHDSEFYRDLWSHVLRGESYQGLIINRKKNGDLYWCAESITPMRDESDEIDHFICVLKDISETRKRQEQELQMQIAREVQQRLIRTTPSISGFDIAGDTRSAVETSGDYFDVIPQPENKFLIVMGDVSGHGIGPALIMTATRAFLRALAQTELDPGTLLTRLNRELVADLDPERYVTLVAVQIDMQ